MLGPFQSVLECLPLPYVAGRHSHPKVRSRFLQLDAAGVTGVFPKATKAVLYLLGRGVTQGLIQSGYV